MENKKEMTIEELKEVLGGTIEESAQLIIPLAAHGYGFFVKPNEGRHDLVDIEGLQEFFRTKGFEFIPGFDGKQNVFVDSQGLRYGNDYILYLLDNDQL